MRAAGGCADVGAAAGEKHWVVNSRSAEGPRARQRTSAAKRATRCASHPAAAPSLRAGCAPAEAAGGVGRAGGRGGGGSQRAAPAASSCPVPPWRGASQRGRSTRHPRLPAAARHPPARARRPRPRPRRRRRWGAPGRRRPPPGLRPARAAAPGRQDSATRSGRSASPWPRPWPAPRPDLGLTRAQQAADELPLHGCDSCPRGPRCGGSKRCWGGRGPRLPAPVLKPGWRGNPRRAQLRGAGFCARRMRDARGAPRRWEGRARWRARAAARRRGRPVGHAGAPGGRCTCLPAASARPTPPRPNPQPHPAPQPLGPAPGSTPNPSLERRARGASRLQRGARGPQRKVLQGAP
jgi:hypothetical protein